MSTSRDKYEEIQGQSYSGIGEFYQNTTQDKFNPIDEYFEKDEKTLMRDLIDELQGWSEGWVMYNERGFKKPIDADELANDLVKRYNIKLK